MRRATFPIDPWLRVHPDDVARHVPATLVKGSETYRDDVAVAILTRPATVDDVARNDDGSIHSVALIDEGGGDLAGRRVVLDFSVSAGHGKHERPQSKDGWWCVIGERFVAPERRRIAVVGMLELWREFVADLERKLPRSAVATFPYKVQDLESDTVWQHVGPTTPLEVYRGTFDDMIELPGQRPIDARIVAMVRAHLRAPCS